MKVLTAYEKSKKAIGENWMQTLTPKNLKVEKKTPSDLWACIKAFNPTQGWIQTLDKILLIQGNFKPIDDIIQTAELINQAGKSLHIRPINNQATAFIYTEIEGEGYLSTTYQHSIQHKDTYQAQYQVYWDVDTQDPRQPIKYSRFIGFVPNNQEQN